MKQRVWGINKVSYFWSYRKYYARIYCHIFVFKMNSIPHQTKNEWNTPATTNHLITTNSYAACWHPQMSTVQLQLQEPLYHRERQATWNTLGIYVDSGGSDRTQRFAQKEGQPIHTLLWIANICPDPKNYFGDLHFTSQTKPNIFAGDGEGTKGYCISKESAWCSQWVCSCLMILGQFLVLYLRNRKIVSNLRKRCFS